mmetsp:Transcript_21616/g.59958  ORF Transcript_21616/g.59958 Transcript_21616/m.59958 type:complete len:362 (-) Transcript_21616:989-2074(-)
MDQKKSKEDAELHRHLIRDFVITHLYVVLWIVLSSLVILINKYVLSYAGFPYPVALTLTHMGFCSILAFFLVKVLRVTDPIDMGVSLYFTNVVPIAGLFSGTLWLGNAAYMFLSVSFIQMLKAVMPIVVYTVGVLMSTEKFTLGVSLNMVVVVTGVLIASHGELLFSTIGVVLQCSSIVTESFRLVLIQILLQRRGIKLNPITTLFYVSPACFVFLCFPFVLLELPKMMNDERLVIQPALLLGSALTAFALNMAVFLLIGKSSALTMNLAGVIKDWILILLSVLLFGSPVTATQIFGYFLSFLGLCYYNYTKFQANKAAAQAAAAQQEQENKQQEQHATGKLLQPGGRGEDLPLLRHAGRL